MTRDEILHRLQSVFESVFLDDVRVTAELTAESVSEWDSLTHITLIVAVESAFGIRFRTGEVELTRNVGEFADLIQRRMSGK